MNNETTEQGLIQTLAPDDLEHLIEQVFNGIMKLPEESRKRLHIKYLERYGWNVK